MEATVSMVAYTEHQVSIGKAIVWMNVVLLREDTEEMSYRIGCQGGAIKETVRLHREGRQSISIRAVSQEYLNPQRVMNKLGCGGVYEKTVSWSGPNGNVTSAFTIHIS